MSGDRGRRAVLNVSRVWRFGLAIDEIDGAVAAGPPRREAIGCYNSGHVTSPHPATSVTVRTVSQT